MVAVFFFFFNTPEMCSSQGLFLISRTIRNDGRIIVYCLRATTEKKNTEKSIPHAKIIGGGARKKRIRSALGD